MGILHFFYNPRTFSFNVNTKTLIEVPQIFQIDFLLYLFTNPSSSYLIYDLCISLNGIKTYLLIFSQKCLKSPEWEGNRELAVIPHPS